MFEKSSTKQRKYCKNNDISKIHGLNLPLGSSNITIIIPDNLSVMISIKLIFLLIRY